MTPAKRSAKPSLRPRFRRDTRSTVFAAASLGLLSLIAVGCSAVVVLPPEPLPEENVEPPGQVALPELIPTNVAPPQVEWTDEVDFSALREGYGRRVDFSARCEDPELRTRAGEALLADDLAEADRLTGMLLARCPVDPSLHLWRFATLLALDRAPEGNLHRRWYLGLIESILKTGDGASSGTPFVTISTLEEYAVLSHLGLTPEQQLLVEGSPRLDAIRARDDAGVWTVVYFNPALHFLRMNGIFAE